MWEALGWVGIELRGLPGRMVTGIVAPQVLFFVGVQHGTLATALAAAGGWTVGVGLYDLARRRHADFFLLYGIILTVVQAAAALYARSPAVFAGGGVIENLLEGLVLLGSVLLCRPLLVHAARIFQGTWNAVPTLPVRAALGRLTVLWALGLLARAVGLYAALAHLTLGQFLLLNTLAGWPLTGIGILASVMYLQASKDLQQPRDRRAINRIAAPVGKAYDPARVHCHGGPTVQRELDFGDRRQSCLVTPSSSKGAPARLRAA